MSTPQTSTLVIRSATDEDLPALVALNSEVQRHHHEAEPDLYSAPDPAAVAAWLVEARGTYEALIAEGAGQPVGYVIFTEHRRAGSPFKVPRHTILVDQLGASERRQGVGRALMEAVHALAAARGVSEVELDVRAINGCAIAFYEALGYRPAQHRMRRLEEQD